MTIEEIVRKRKRNLQIATQIQENLKNLNKGSDSENRIQCLTQGRNPAYDLEVKDGVYFADVAHFVKEFHEKSPNGKLLEQKDSRYERMMNYFVINDMLRKRKIEKDFYTCICKTADIMFSGKYDDYDSVKFARRNQKEL